MLLYPKYKTVLVHIPRTSGNYIYSLVENNPEYIILKGKVQHATIEEVREMLPGWKAITILRNPYDIFYSYFYFCKEIIYSRNPIYSEKLVEFAKFCNPDAGVNKFTESLIERSIICKFGGFQSTYTDRDTIKLNYNSQSLPGQLKQMLNINYDLGALAFTKHSMAIGDSSYEYYYRDNNYFKNMIKFFCYKDFYYGSQYD